MVWLPEHFFTEVQAVLSGNESAPPRSAIKEQDPPPIPPKRRQKVSQQTSASSANSILLPPIPPKRRQKVSQQTSASNANSIHLPPIPPKRRQKVNQHSQGNSASSTNSGHPPAHGNPFPGQGPSASVSPPPSPANLQKENGPVIIPSGEDMSAREMAECIKQNMPVILRQISEKSRSVPQQLESLATLLKSFVDNARGSGVQFRISRSVLRSQIGVLKDNATPVWRTNTNSIIEALNLAQQHVKSMLKNSID